MSDFDSDSRPAADIIIIGAGISGLSTALAFLEKNLSLEITILEATDRIGGRIFSDIIPARNGTPLQCDLGGHWLSSQQSVLLNLIQDFGLKTEREADTGRQIFDYKGRIHKQKPGNPFGFTDVMAKLEFAGFIRKLEGLCQKERLDPELASTTMEDFINRAVSRTVNRAIMRFIILLNCGVEPKSITVGFYVFYCISTYGFANQLTFDRNGPREFWLQDGTQQVCAKMRSLLQDDYNFLKRAKVLAIKATTHGVEIVCGNRRTLHSTYVVLTVPPPQILEIEFTPPLPDSKIEALNRSITGTLSKFVATYSKPFWREKGLSGDVFVLDQQTTDQPLVCCFDSTTTTNPVLAGYFIKSGENVQNLILARLAHYLGDEALSPILFRVMEWPQGSPMCCYPSLSDVHNIKTKTDRIFWAGAETSYEWYGSIAGGFLSGIRASHEIMYDIRPASMSMDDMTLVKSPLPQLRKRGKSYNSVYKKVVSPYYQGGVLVAVVMLVVLWRVKLKDAQIKWFL